MAATTLMDIKNLPSARLHRLEGKRAGQYAVDLVHPHRLVLKPILDEGENIENLKGITIVMIEEVTDYHGKQKDNNDFMPTIAIPPGETIRRMLFLGMTQIELATRLGITQKHLSNILNGNARSLMRQP